MARKNAEVASWFKPKSDPVCPLCERKIPPSQVDKHHLVPKLKGGKHTEELHRICHRQIHALFTESELANKFNTVHALLSDQDMAAFVDWVKRQPDDYLSAPKQSRRKR